jgi:hypothetical protein
MPGEIGAGRCDWVIAKPQVPGSTPGGGDTVDEKEKTIVPKGIDQLLKKRTAAAAV